MHLWNEVLKAVGDMFGGFIDYAKKSSLIECLGVAIKVRKLLWFYSG